MRARLVIITGSAPGAGKSTLMRTLAAGLRGLGDKVLEVSEDAVWGERQLGTLPVDYATAWPEFRALLHERPCGGSPTHFLEFADRHSKLAHPATRGISPSRE